MAGFWQEVPRRVLARQRFPNQSGPKRVATPDSINFLWLAFVNIFMSPAHGVARSFANVVCCVRALTLIHGPCTTALGPLLKGHETRCPDQLSVTRLVLLEQPVADQ